MTKKTFGIALRAATALAIAGLLWHSVVHAQSPAATGVVPHCALSPDTPQYPASIFGFPGDHAFIYRTHWRLCGTAMETCEHVTSLSTAADVKTTSDCDGWSYISTSDAPNATRGWIDSRWITTGGHRATFDGSKSEHLKSASDPAVCKAAVSGSVTNVDLDDIGGYGLIFDSIRRSSDSSAQPTEPVFSLIQILAVGSVDLDNDGTSDRIGLAIYDLPAETIGNTDALIHEPPIHREWPVELAADGTPRPHTPLNLLAFSQGSAYETTRLFRFSGSTYVEYRSLIDDTAKPQDDPFGGDSSPNFSHEIWKYTTSGGQRICEFEKD